MNKYIVSGEIGLETIVRETKVVSLEIIAENERHALLMAHHKIGDEIYDCCNEWWWIHEPNIDNQGKVTISVLP